MRRYVENYTNIKDSYIRKIIARHDSTRLASEIPQEEVEEKRKYLIHYREMKSINYNLEDNRKYCWRCKTLYDNTESHFPKLKNTYDGFCSDCKVCKKEKRKIDYWKHRDTYIQEATDWNNSNEEKRTNILQKCYNKAKKSEGFAERRRINDNNYRKSEGYLNKGKLYDSMRSTFRAYLKLYTDKGKTRRSYKYGVDYHKCFIVLEESAKALGYSIKELRDMKYHIDHKIPVSAYNLNDKNEIKNCWSPLNLQWLSASKNSSKGNKLIVELIKTLPKEIYPKSWNGVIPTSIKMKGAA